MTRVSLFASNGVDIERHAYCLCLHVRPATIFVALINLGGSLISACLTLFLMINNDFKSSYFSSRFVRDEISSVTGISVLMYLFLTLVSAMLLYGVIKSKPNYIVPFFGIQFIDYLFTMPHFLASIYTHPYHYASKNKDQVWMDDQYKNQYPEMRNIWPNASTSHIHTTSLLFMTLILIFKTYFLCVVWKCYRYLHMKEFILPIALNNNNLASDAMMTPIVITQSNAPPPNYDEATKMPDYKPPDYITVTENREENPPPPPSNTESNQQTQSKST